VYAHGKHVEVGRLGLGKLDAGDAQRPDIDARPIVLLQHQLGRLEGKKKHGEPRWSGDVRVHAGATNRIQHLFIEGWFKRKEKEEGGGRSGTIQ
jgi:hypothetical protein